MKQEGLIAVIVGIDGYKDVPLQCAVNDAVYLTETLSKVWQHRTITIKTLIWPSIKETRAKQQQKTWGIDLPEDAHEVTRENILSEVRKCASMARESDTFIFYFSGHGELTDEEPVLLTVSDAKTAKGIEKIKIRELQEAAANCASRKKVMILDCCQSSTSKGKPAEEYKDLEELTREWSILLSSSPGEVSLEDQYFGNSRDDYLQQGIFTASLVEGLRGEAAGESGSVSLAELVYFVSKRVPVEYQERLDIILENMTKPIKTRGLDSFSQNPVLLTEAVALDGPYQVIMAPQFVPTSHSARRRLPGKHFIKSWFKFLWGRWPVMFTYRPGFVLASLLYAATMTLTVILHCTKTIDQPKVLFFCGVGMGSVFIWWVTLSFAIAANEDRWHLGGYLTGIFYMLWHFFVVLWFAWTCGIESGLNQEPSHFVYVITDLFFILLAVVVYNCNTSQTIIALAETLREDERREIRQAIRAFQQFKYKMIGVDLYNFVPMVPVRPEVYFFLWGISMAVIVFNIYQVMIAAELETVRMLILITRNIFAAMMLSWLIFWYDAAFKFLKKEVYKR